MLELPPEPTYGLAVLEGGGIQHADRLSVGVDELQIHGTALAVGGDDGHLDGELVHIAVLGTLFLAQLSRRGDAPVVDARVLRIEDQRHGTVEAGTGIPARALLDILQIDLKEVLSHLHELRDIHTERVVAVGPATRHLAVDADHRLSHGTVKHQFGVTVEPLGNSDRAPVVSLTYPRQGTAAATLLGGLGLTVLFDGHTLQVPHLVKGTADGPVVGNGDRLPDGTRAERSLHELPAVGEHLLAPDKRVRLRRSCTPSLQTLILLTCQAQERTVLRTFDATDVLRVTEVTHKLVGLTQAVVLRTRGILDIADGPVVLAGQLEGRDALALLLALEVHIVIGHGLRPRARQRGCRRGEESRLSALLLNHHVPLPVTLQPIDVGIDGGVAPVEEQARLRQLRERFIGIRVVHTVVEFLATVPHGVVDEVAALATVGPAVGGVPDGLRRPDTVHRRPVLIDTGRCGVAEDGRTLAVVQRRRFPVYEVVTPQQGDAVVVPLGLLLQLFEGTNVHVGAEHQVARAVVPAEDVGIAGGTLDAGMLVVAEHGVTV